MKLKYNAFTLAEVLITLAIIGVVTAITIPTVVTNYRKEVYVTQLKKAYTTVVQSFRMAMARDGVTRLQDTILWAKLPTAGTITVKSVTEKAGSTSGRAIQNKQRYKDFLDEFYKVFNAAIKNGESVTTVAADIKYKELTGKRCSICDNESKSFVVLPDGAFINVEFYSNPVTSECSSITNASGNGEDVACNSFADFKQTKQTSRPYWKNVGTVYIDVNGIKGPNVAGRDFFVFGILEDGNLNPWGGQDDILIYATPSCNSTNIESEECQYHWNHNGDSYSCNNKTAKSDGLSCAGRVVDKGWKMDY